MRYAGWIGLLSVVLAVALTAQAVVGGAATAVAVVVVLAAIGFVRSLWFGDLRLLRRR